MSLETTLTLILAAVILIAALLIQLALTGVFRVLRLAFRGGRAAGRHPRQRRNEDVLPRVPLRERLAPVARGAVAGSRSGLGHVRSALARAGNWIVAAYRIRMEELSALLAAPAAIDDAEVIQLDDARDLSWDPLDDARVAAGGSPLIDPGFR